MVGAKKKKKTSAPQSRSFRLGGIYFANVHSTGDVSGHYVIVSNYDAETVTVHVCTSHPRPSDVTVYVGSMIAGQKDTYVLKAPEVLRHSEIKADTRVTVDRETAEDLGFKLR